MYKSKQATRFLTRWGLFLGIFGFALLAAFATHASLEFRSFTRLVMHTNEVVSEIRQLDAMIERAETSQRGFLITKNLTYLRPYNQAIENVGTDYRELANLVSDNPVQVARVKQLEGLIKTRLDKMQTVIENSTGTPIEEIARQIDLNVMTEIRTKLDEMEQEELGLMKTRRAQYDQFSDLSTFLLMIGAMAAALVMLFSARLVKAASRRNSEQSALLTSVFDSMTDGVLVMNKDFVITHSNRASDDLTDQKLEGLTLEQVYQVSRPEKMDGFVDVKNSSLSRAMRGETVMRFEVTMGRTSRRLVSVDSRAVRGADGEIVAAFSVYQDITQRRQTEEQWHQAREAAIEASQLKSDFLATMSHEIRTPMNGVMGMATLLLNTPMTKEQEQYVQTIKSSADSLLSLINQVLDHAKIESGKIELERNDFDLNDVIEGVMSLFRYLARSKEIELKVHVEEDVPVGLIGDPNRLRQILLNLVGNAIKFTERGFVELHVKRLADGRFEFGVKDTGPGIASDKQAQLFKKFSQVHDKKYVKAAGSGLGLMISNELAKAMGGQMGVESVVGLGSRFWFTAEFAVSVRGEVCEWKPEPQAKEPISARILVAEDQMVNQLVIRKFLEGFGANVVIVEDGSAAVRAMRDDKFDLILMDCRMEPMDGYEATRQIREFSKIPIVALTAEGTSGDRKSCFAAGMDEVLNKPVDIEQLYRVLKHYLARPEFSEAQLDKLAGYESDGKALMEVLVADFLVNGARLVEQIVAGMTSSQDVRHQAHALRSPALTLGLTALSDHCAMIEEGGANLKDTQKLKELYQRGCDWLSRQTRSSRAS